MKRVLLSLAFGLALMPAAVLADTLTWTGGSGVSDNFNDAANWSSDGSHATPESGDTLVFMGETRTSPVNDLDPEQFTFKELIFSNDNSSGRSAPFTISGNKIVLSSAITVVQCASGSLTETFDADVEFAGVGGKSVGGASVDNHNLVFNKSFSGPDDLNLNNPGQYRSAIYFNGPVSGFSTFRHLNGNINVYFLGLNTAFSVNGYDFGQGNLHFIDAGNVGPSPVLTSGQPGYATAGTIYFDPTNDVTVAARICCKAPRMSANGLTLCNNTDGTTVTFTGEVYEGGTDNANTADPGTRLVATGAGDGVFAGSFTAARMAFTKQGAGTWTLSDAIETCSMTGLVTVSAGKLVVDCSLQSNQRLTVAANATIAGKGSLGESAVFAANSRYEVAANGDGLDTLTVPGVVTLSGNVTVNRTGGDALAPGSHTVLMVYGAKDGAGSFVTGGGFPGNAVLTAGETALYVDVPAETRTWNGGDGGEWNTTGSNWEGGLLYADGNSAKFPDISDAAKRAVSIPASVRPMSVTVSANDDRPYVFSGDGGVDGASSIRFAGTATNVWEAAMRNIPAVDVAAGGLLLEGAVENCALTVGEGAVLTQSTASAISGSSSVAVYGPRADLCGANTFTGGLVVGRDSGSANSSKSTVYAMSPDALGRGDVTVCDNSSLEILADCAVTNRTLHFWGYNGRASCINVRNNLAFEWAGDVVVHEHPGQEMISAGTSSVHLGKRDLTSTFSVTHDQAVTLIGNIHMYANFDSAAGLSFRNNLWLYSTNNVWSSFRIASGSAYMMAKGALPGNRPVRMLQQWNKVPYQANLHLDGFDQTVSSIDVTDYDMTVQNYARLMSTLPATLTVSNAVDSSFNDAATFYVQECLTLRKMGLGVWTIGCQNTSAGDFEVMEGTVSVADAQSLPVGEESTLRVAGGAFLDLPSGVAAEISRAERISGERARVVPAGLYGGKDCADASASKVEWITGDGTLRVKSGSAAGMMLIIR